MISRRRIAFTLVELLLVISILALLAAIIFPVFPIAREKARSASCASNLHQLGQALSMYASDFDDQYPYSVDAIAKYNHNHVIDPEMDAKIRAMPLLTDVLHAYVADRGLWRCPSDTGLVAIEWSASLSEHSSQYQGVSPSLFTLYGNSYRYNSQLPLLHKRQSGSIINAESKAEVSTSGVAVMEDGTYRWHGNGPSSEDGRANVLFGDGHVDSASGQSRHRIFDAIE